MYWKNHSFMNRESLATFEILYKNKDHHVVTFKMIRISVVEKI